MTRVLIAGFKHETNTFSGLSTGLDAYKARQYHVGAEIPKAYLNTRSEIAGFMEACERHGWEPVYAVAADATPSGKVRQEMFELVLQHIDDALERAGGVQAVLLQLHGAMVCEHTPDGEGSLLAELRERIGRDVPIGVTLDLHANVTERMAELADVMVSYHTYPHTDQVETATECADLIARTLAGEIKPRVHIARREMIDGADHGRTTSPGPMREVLKSAEALKRESGVLSTSINAGFPYADIHDTGPTAVVVGDGDDPRYTVMADDLMAQIWESRHRKTVETVSAETAMAAVRPNPAGGPLVIADFADNPGGGGYGDSTGLLRAMVEANLRNAAFATLFDPVAVRTSTDQGLGAQVVVALGGKIDPRFGGPVPVTATVKAITDGTLRFEGPMMAGTRIDMGPTVVLAVGGLDIIVTSGRFQAYDQMFFKHARIDPAEKDVVAVKSAHHFRAAFGPIASEILCVDDGGGLTSHDYAKLPFANVRRPVWPLDLD